MGAGTVAGDVGRVITGEALQIIGAAMCLQLSCGEGGRGKGREGKEKRGEGETNQVRTEALFATWMFSLAAETSYN